MFANFKKAFKQDETMYEIPEAILESLSDKLPDGFNYVQVDKEICAVTSKSKEISVNVNFNIDDKINITNSRELGEYLYRTQREVVIDSNFIELNGVKFNVNELIKMPLSKNKIDEENIKLVLKPHPFPEPFILMIGYGQDYIPMTFQRQPYQDLHKSLFKSIDRKSIIISYILDEVLENITFKVNINIAEAESVDEVVIITQIYKLFMSGKLKIAGIELNREIGNINEENGLDSLIEFWNKVNLISKKLGILFNPQKELKKRDVKLLERLYKSLVENKVYKELVNIEEIEVTCYQETDNSSLLNKDGLVLESLGQNEYELLGIKLSIWDFVMWCNLRIKDIILIDKNKFTYNFMMDTESSKKAFKIVKHFNSKEEAEKYREHISRKVEDLESIELIDMLS